MRTLDPGLAPLHGQLRGTGEEDVETERVGAVAGDHVVGGDGVALRLRHDLPVLVNHPLREEARDGLVEVDQAQVAHDLGPEAGVDEVQDRVLDAAHVEVDREPVAHGGGVDRAVVLLRREIAVEVPGRVHEGVHGVRLAPGFPSAPRAGRAHERLHLLERVSALAREGRVGREDDRQLVVGHRLHAVLLAVDDRDRRAPVALPADEPVLEAVRGRGLADALLPRPLGHLRDGLVGGHAVEGPAVDDEAGAVVRGRHRGAVQALALGLDDDAHLEAVLAGELEVALVVGGDGHDGAGAVAHQHEVADPDRDLLVRERVRGVAAGEDTFLLDPALEARPAVLGPQPGDLLLARGRVLLPREQAVDHRVLRGEDHEGRAPDGVDAGREDADRLAARRPGSRPRRRGTCRPSSSAGRGRAPARPRAGPCRRGAGPGRR